MKETEPSSHPGRTVVAAVPGGTQLLGRGVVFLVQTCPSGGSERHR